MRSRPGRRTCRTQALFGWGKKPEKTEREWDREDQWAIQQDLLRKRRSGEMIDEADERRRKVAETVQSRKDVRTKERSDLGEGIMPETLKNWKNYDAKMEKNSRSGIVIPTLPFGMQKYDEGERFDLRSPYSDDGWVDPEETDMWGGFRKIGEKLLNFGGQKAPDKTQKPILWASSYGKTLDAQKRKKQAEVDSKKGKQ
ncbi:MAG: hypothetical protein WDW36_009757 [Sanguina aurantia]